MEKLFNDFIRERRYLRNLSEKTLTYYQECYAAFARSGDIENLSKTELQSMVMTMRERGMSPSAINAYGRGFNAFLSWLHEQGHEKLRVQALKCEKRQFRALTEKEMRAIAHFKPQTRAEKRLHTLLCLLMDTGLRISEALGLRVGDIDLDNMLLAVTGKGGKERIVPFSFECRKILFKVAKGQEFNYVFANRNGGKLTDDNLRRDFKLFMGKIGVEPDGAFHQLRRTFATSYMRNGGNPLVLQRLLGHSTLTMTNVYVKMVSDDLSKEQHRTSLLNRLR